MSDGILSHLGRRMTREQERLATEGLAYLLGRSNVCSDVIRQVATLAGCSLDATIRYRAEAPGADLARPDVVGCDAEEREVVIIEGKFAAGLTDNQPAAYLDSAWPNPTRHPDLRRSRAAAAAALGAGEAADLPDRAGCGHRTGPQLRDRPAADHGDDIVAPAPRLDAACCAIGRGSDHGRPPATANALPAFRGRDVPPVRYGRTDRAAAATAPPRPLRHRGRDREPARGGGRDHDRRPPRDAATAGIRPLCQAQADRIQRMASWR